MERYLSDEDEPEKPDDIDFTPYTMEYMFETGNMFLQHGVLPSGGGWNDEDAAWTDALGKWLALRRYLKHQRDGSGDKDTGDVLGGLLKETHGTPHTMDDWLRES